MPEHTLPPSQRLLALSRYIGALERGELEPLAEVLHEAEHDTMLAGLLQEIDAMYQEGEQTAASEWEVRQTLQTALAPLLASTAGQPGQETRGQQPSPPRDIRIKPGEKEAPLQESEITPIPPQQNVAPHQLERPRWGWIEILAAILVVGMLSIATSTAPALLSLRQHSGSGSPVQRTPANLATGHNPYQALARQYVAQMTLDEEIGQLLMVEYPEPSYSSNLDSMIHVLHVGGVLMNAWNITSFDQVKSDTAHMQQRSHIPLLISTSEEGGIVDRLQHLYGPSMSATSIERTGSTTVAAQQGLKTSQHLAALGINVNLAPDIDVSQVYNPQLDTRTFGNTSDQVITFAGAYLQALQGNGTIACLTHFPGLGDATGSDPFPLVKSTRQHIYDIDLAPFKAFIQSPDAWLNPGMVMSVDVLMPAIDPTYPAELSHTFITDILRNQFHYDGVVLADTLYMQGNAQRWNRDQAAVLALQAGDDMLLGATDTQQALSMINAIKQALQDGQLTKARIDESVTRIIALKMQYHLMPATVPGT